MTPQSLGGESPLLAIVNCVILDQRLRSFREWLGKSYLVRYILN